MNDLNKRKNIQANPQRSLFKHKYLKEIFFLGMTNRFFLFNQISKRNITDHFVLDWINAQFGLRFFDEKIKLLDPKQRFMTEEESSFNLALNFDLDFNYFNDPICTSHRLKFGSKIYHSQDYNPVSRKNCNYVISFKQTNLTCYGLIKYFFKASDEIFVAINELKIVGNLYDNLGARTNVEITNLRNCGAFKRFFCYCKEINNLIIIHSSVIITKCIATKVDDSSYCVSEYVELLEHN